MGFSHPKAFVIGGREHALEQNSSARGFDSRKVLGFFLLFQSSVVCPYQVPGGGSTLASFLSKNCILSCAAGGETSIMCIDLEKSISH